MSKLPTSFRRSRRALVAVTVVAVTGAAVASTAPAGAGTPNPKAKAKATKVVPIGTYPVGEIEKTFVDESRPTVPNGTYPGAESRTLRTDIFYPATGTPGGDAVPDAPPETKDAPYPLILFSHGVTANSDVYTASATRWASAGYVVALPNYPSSNSDAEGGVSIASGVADVKNQPADATFVIDQVLGLNQTDGDPLAGMIDPKRIGASGHSLGGITTYGLVYSDCCRDPRIKAAIPMSGIAGIVDDTYFEGKNVPVLIMHGDADPLIPYRSSTSAFADAKGPKFLLTFLGAGHVTPFIGSDDPQASTLFAATTDFWDRYLKGDKKALARLREDAPVSGQTTFEEETGTAAGVRKPN